jgi:hypothetical protein
MSSAPHLVTGCVTWARIFERPFSQGLTASWLRPDARAGGLWLLDTASLSALSYEHDSNEPVIRFWNATAHLMPIAEHPI